MTTVVRWPVFVLVASLIWTVGCTSERQDYRDRAAKEYCAEAQRCDNLGAGSIPESRADCVIEMRADFNQRWPADRCDRGRIDDAAYEQCLSRALDVACDGGLLTRLDELNRCRAGNVCTAEPCEVRVFDRCIW